MRTAMCVLVAVLAVPVAVTRAGDLPEAWVFTGRTEASNSAVLRSQVNGRVTRVVVKEGDAVAKGDLLIEIDPQPYQLALDAAQAQANAAEARLKAAHIAGGNAASLREKSVISPQELALKKAEEAEAEAELRLAKVQVERAKLDLSRTHVTAPFNGTVSRILTADSTVTANQTQVLSVVSTDPLHISFNVPETVLLQLRRQGAADPRKLGVAVGYADELGQPHEAKLDFIEPEVDSRTRSVRFQASVPNPKGIFSPGMSTTVRLTPAPR